MTYSAEVYNPTTRSWLPLSRLGWPLSDDPAELADRCRRYIAAGEIIDPALLIRDLETGHIIWADTSRRPDTGLPSPDPYLPDTLF